LCTPSDPNILTERDDRCAAAIRDCDDQRVTAGRTASTITEARSTETALAKVLSDIFTAVDQQLVTLLGLLDLIAAFDCVDHM